MSENPQTTLLSLETIQLGLMQYIIHIIRRGPHSEADESFKCYMQTLGMIPDQKKFFELLVRDKSLIQDLFNLLDSKSLAIPALCRLFELSSRSHLPFLLNGLGEGGLYNFDQFYGSVLTLASKEKDPVVFETLLCLIELIMRTYRENRELGSQLKRKLEDSKRKAMEKFSEFIRGLDQRAEDPKKIIITNLIKDLRDLTFRIGNGHSEIDRLRIDRLRKADMSKLTGSEQEKLEAYLTFKDLVEIKGVLSILTREWAKADEETIKKLNNIMDTLVKLGFCRHLIQAGFLDLFLSWLKSFNSKQVEADVSVNEKQMIKIAVFLFMSKGEDDIKFFEQHIEQVMSELKKTSNSWIWDRVTFGLSSLAEKSETCRGKIVQANIVDRLTLFKAQLDHDNTRCCQAYSKLINLLTQSGASSSSEHLGGDGVTMKRVEIILNCLQTPGLNEQQKSAFMGKLYATIEAASEEEVEGIINRAAPILTPEMQGEIRDMFDALSLSKRR